MLLDNLNWGFLKWFLNSSEIDTEYRIKFCIIDLNFGENLKIKTKI